MCSAFVRDIEIPEIDSYTLSWTKKDDPNFVSDLEDLEGLSAGIYVINIKDSNECVFEGEVTVTEPDQLVVEISEKVAIECNGEATAVIETTVNGGVLDYNYQWFLEDDLGNRSIIVGETANEIAGREAGNYVVEVTDANDNKAEDQFTISEPSKIIISEVITQVSCFGGKDASIDLSVSGGTAGSFPGGQSYTYEWTSTTDSSFFSTQQDISSISAGEYTVEVLDRNSCLATKKITITQPSLGLAISYEVENLKGFQTNDGKIDITISGGTPDYKFTWEKIGDPTFTQDTEDINNLSTGVYMVRVLDGNNCDLESELIQVTEPEFLEVTIDNPTSEAQIQCFEEAIPRALSLSVKGGKEPYSYQWFSLPDLVLLGESEQSPLFRAGNYQVRVEDVNGNASTDIITLVEPTELLVNSTVKNVSCNGFKDGEIELTVTGGTPPYTFEWNTGAITKDITNLQAGAYEVRVRDKNLCATPIEIIAIEVTEPNPLQTVGQTQRVFPSSPTVKDGTIALQLSGGTSPYGYEWFNSNGDIVNSGMSISGDIQLTGTDGFIHSIAIKDQNDCELVIDNVDDIPVLPLLVELNQLGVIRCNGDSTASITSRVTGGIPFNGVLAYEYQWFDEVTDRLISEGEPLLENIPRGSYYVTITDAQGTRKRSNIISISEPVKFEFESVNTDFVNCGRERDWSVQINVIGGQAPYSYRLNNTQINGSSTTTASPGVQNILVTDALGCSISQMITLVPPPAITINPLVIQPQCFNSCEGEISINPTGGTPPYTIDWVGGERAIKLCSDDSITIDATLPQAKSYLWTSNTGFSSTAASITVSETGVYQVAVTTDLECTVLAEKRVEKLEPLIIDLEADFVNCGLEADWTITSTVTGGESPYFYSWSNRATTSTIENIREGTYTLSIRDQQGCEVQKAITIANPIAFDFGEVNIVQPVCFEACTGSIDFELISGVPPFTYRWNTGADTASINGLCKGIYVVTIIDAKGCEIMNSFEITEPEEFTIDLGEDITLCKDQNTTLNAFNSNGISYQWTLPSGQTVSGASIEVEEQGEYAVQVRNASDCLAEDSIFVDVSTAAISSEFIGATQVFVNEPFVMVNIADPAPEILKWELPEVAKINEIENNFVELYFEQPGTYEVGFEASIGLCTDVTFKKVVVLERGSIKEQEAKPEVSSFVENTIFPNPLVGKEFSIVIKMSEVSEVSIRIFSAGSSQKLAERIIVGSKEYKEDFSLFNAASGLHFVVIQSKFGSQVYKLIVD